eukprot:m.661580 g.661580  ORF g.661580 m.661580 type:complete len:126 (+) comp22737_c0_seq45:843-1220(+)
MICVPAKTEIVRDFFETLVSLLTETAVLAAFIQVCLNTHTHMHVFVCALQPMYRHMHNVRIGALTYAHTDLSANTHRHIHLCTLTDGPTCAYTNNTSACLCCNSVAYRNRQFGAVLDDLQDLVRS